MNQKIQGSISDILKTRNQRDDVPLVHQHIGDLQLPTGQLVACDPLLVTARRKPFSLQLPCGNFPVFVSVESIEEFKFTRHAIIQFSDGPPVRWEMMTVRGQDLEEPSAGQYFGYPVDTGTGCFFDFSMTRAAEPKSHFWKTIRASLAAKMESPQFNLLNGFNVQASTTNLIAFQSGFGDGVYGTFAGFDADGRVCAVVTDF